jgi:hypothetical protein
MTDSPGAIAAEARAAAGAVEVGDRLGQVVVYHDADLNVQLG